MNYQVIVFQLTKELKPYNLQWKNDEWCWWGTSHYDDIDKCTSMLPIVNKLVKCMGKLFASCSAWLVVALSAHVLSKCVIMQRPLFLSSLWFITQLEVLWPGRAHLPRSQESHHIDIQHNIAPLRFTDVSWHMIPSVDTSGVMLDTLKCKYRSIGLM